MVLRVAPFCVDLESSTLVMILVLFWLLVASLDQIWWFVGVVTSRLFLLVFWVSFCTSLFLIFSVVWISPVCICKFRLGVILFLLQLLNAVVVRVVVSSECGGL